MKEALRALIAVPLVVEAVVIPGVVHVVLPRETTRPARPEANEIMTVDGVVEEIAVGIDTAQGVDGMKGVETVAVRVREVKSDRAKGKRKTTRFNEVRDPLHRS